MFSLKTCADNTSQQYSIQSKGNINAFYFSTTYW